MPRDRRGQLLLVAALVLAVAFVALALVLNAVVFTENLATRNHDRTDDAIGFENAVDAGVGGIVVQANRYDASDYATVRGAVRDGVAVWDENATRLAAADGRVTDTEIVRLDNGTRILQDDPTRAVTNHLGTPDWTVAEDITETRRFEMVVTPRSTSSPMVFHVESVSGTASWRFEVIEDGSGGTAVSAFKNGTQVAAATAPSDTVTLDVTEGTLDGAEIANWTFAEGVDGPYDMSVDDGDNAEGEYVLVVDRPRGDLLADMPDSYDDPGTGDYPTTTPAVYRAVVDVTVRQSTLTYGTTLAVEPEDGVGAGGPAE
ncbi:DUF7261 family protein [Halobacterium litoreum]|uniref:Flagellin n=1 Tax=Halobacterium litoreum TaxID=2039234 RepID=A0ABD5NIV8_9EURY|nr:hypothetical protein [Halobacterium litoreum]UHH12241.1 hypothetical protein LT972_08735 [Halobacterium litoreum]